MRGEGWERQGRGQCGCKGAAQGGPLGDEVALCVTVVWLHKSPRGMQGWDCKCSLYQCHFPGFGVAYCCVNIQPWGRLGEGTSLHYFFFNF